jgi:hypothetical protein
MKTWLFKTKNSNALDQALQSQLPKCEFPPSLHDSIMREVRNAARSSEASPVLWPRWVAISSFACVLMLGFFVAVHFSNTPSGKVTQSDMRALDAAGSVLELGGNIVREAPDAAISPLQDEMQRMNHDLDRTKQFLIASLP